MMGTLASILVTTALAFVGGALGAALYLRSQPLPVRVEVLDMRRVIAEIAADPTLDEMGRHARTKAVSNDLALLIAERAAQGVIVLDGSAVLRAPPQSYVTP